MSDLNLKSDRYFPESREIVIDTRSGKLSFSPNRITGFGYDPPKEVSDYLSKISQLGLKELWLKGTPGSHSRWDHSKGVLTVSLVWLKFLEEANVVPSQCLPWPTDSWDKVRALAGLAALLHDYGHLPFSHLLEEVLDSINWVPQPAEGLETTLLKHRLRSDYMEPRWKWLANQHLGQGSRVAVSPADAAQAVISLISGSHGLPWLQAIINSPVDADKIDYLMFDADLLESSAFAVSSRLQQNRPDQWLSEFLSDQQVNHAGMLALNGRSSVAAADLWRERMFLYDRFYLSPSLRVAERMAGEIVQQFLIRSTMSMAFARKIRPGVKPLEERLRELKAADPIAQKYESARDVMLSMLGQIKDHWLEFDILNTMKEYLGADNGIDEKYREFLDKCFNCLRSVCPDDPDYPRQEPAQSLRRLVDDSLVREPLLIRREQFRDAREMLRPVQHTYSREVLIDIVRLPHVLAGSRPWHERADGIPSIDYSILVPEGPVSGWGPGAIARCPLSDECVKELEQPYARVILICPLEGDSPKAEYVWDRVRATLLDGGIQLVQRNE